MDIQLMEQQLKGFEEKGKQLRAQEAIFLKVQGMKEQIEQSRSEAADLESDVQDLKEQIAELKGRKADAVKGTIDAITKMMNVVLPEGEAVFEIDGGVSIGWKIGGVVKPYQGLSGGERVVFDGAMANALGAGLMICEAAEADLYRLTDLVAKLSETERQVIINT
jgi:chromosome segregation ATPase